MSSAFVTTNLLDMRARPGFLEERVNQLFYCQVVETWGRRKGYLRVVAEDGYQGWADERFLQPIGNTKAREYSRSLNAYVKIDSAVLSESPHQLFYGTPVRCATIRNGVATCVRPDLTRFKLKGSALVKPKSIRRNAPTGSEVVREAKRFLGVPYLWGGVSSCGFDCSGFVRTIFAQFGIGLPRDTKDQIRVGQKVSRIDVTNGDLLFFKRHVGIALGGEHLIHASLGGGGVRINSLESDGSDYRADLDHTFAIARRLL